MPRTYLPTKDADLVAWLANFITVANANLVALGLEAGDITPISTLQPTYSTNLNNVEAKKAAYSASVDTKNATKSDIITNVRVVVNKIQANPDVTVALKAELGISTHEGGSYPETPVAPIDLIAELQPNGAVELDWSRNGNAPGTLFVVEWSVFPGSSWTLLDIVTKTSYVHTGAPLGNALQYWVKARRSDVTSGPSNIAFINLT